MGKKEGRRLTIQHFKGGENKPWIKDYKPEPPHWEVIYYSKEQGKVIYELFYTESDALKRKDEIKRQGYKEKQNKSSTCKLCTEEDIRGRFHGGWSTNKYKECPKCWESNIDNDEFANYTQEYKELLYLEYEIKNGNLQKEITKL